MLTKTTKKVPKLRFPEFEGEWEEVRLGEITKINQGLQISISERSTKKVENSYFYITNEFLRKNSQKEYYITNPSKSVICDMDDILMTRTGNTGMVVTNVTGVFHNNFFKIKYEKSKLIKDFFVHFLKLKKTKNKILTLAGNSTIPDLNHSDFYKITIQYPSLPEQNKIADFLSVVDSKIDNLKTKKEKLELYKKGIMAQIFNQKIRFKDENGQDYPAWEEVRLGDFLSPANKQSVQNTSEFRKITIKLNLKGLEYSNLKRKMADTRPFYKRFKGELIIGKQNFFNGSLAIVSDEFNGCICSNAIMSFTFSNSVNRYFIFNRLSVKSFLRKSEIMANGTGQKEISEKLFLDFKINLPTLPEQNKIANFLTSIDNQIDAVTKQLDQTKLFKKSLLQQLLI